MLTLKRCKYFKIAEIWPQGSKVIQGHIRPLLSFLAHSFIDDFDENFDECYYHIKTKKFHQIIWPKMSLLCYGDVLWFLTLRPSDLITTLTFVLMDNFCPCLSQFLSYLAVERKSSIKRKIVRESIEKERL